VKSSQIFTSVISTLAGIAITSLVVYLIPNGWGSIFWFFGAFFGWFARTTPIWNWLLVLLVGAMLVVLFGAVLVLLEYLRSKRDEVEEPTRLTIYGVNWMWNYSSSLYATEPASFCPVCDMQIRSYNVSQYAASYQSRFHCDCCGWSSKTIEASEDAIHDYVKRRFQQELRRAYRENDERKQDAA